ncbi:gamma carbonic anhydrase family protein [Paramaledivibacter caminithermalis]|jgi:carbonic anhydrase/acetyltransferase-like protein (isoleucine patch superfamily)|uniref:Carbonic anhydrase or acetyltransferase, isoleucine patch superfamily n=1 Tax=Paramaledivibacter caminithermalis (strain DSM 15212 / CIP 107654 / DViRD3) TaxID=1121301 RepID=A0A1M6RB86_PARC5|nr:gamma carbonic anhydrase family protein [Paramaledivibacter caminithermalis]SHK29696.1 Carbonic anhydrase or acetyltransferase, isoleucine patch superfamily [Paramaledivibacter caminithermalis DSM 15212]
MIKEFEGIIPKLDEKIYIADGAKIIGDVTMKEYSSIWFNTVVRGDVNRIEIGCYTNIQDNSVVHVADDFPTIIGDFVTVGHNVTLHGCTIEDHCLIGMSATILNGAFVGKGSIIAAGALVKENHIIPPNSLVMGVPGKIVKTIPQNQDSIHAQALKYKTLWTERYNIMPNAGGERYKGDKII